MILLYIVVGGAVGALARYGFATLVAVGVLGAFTTFSTSSYETVALLEDGAWGRAAAYAAGSLVLGIVAVYAGIALAGYLLHGRSSTGRQGPIRG